MGAGLKDVVAFAGGTIGAKPTGYTNLVEMFKMEDLL